MTQLEEVRNNLKKAIELRKESIKLVTLSYAALLQIYATSDEDQDATEEESKLFDEIENILADIE